MSSRLSSLAPSATVWPLLRDRELRQQKAHPRLSNTSKYEITWAYLVPFGHNTQRGRRHVDRHADKAIASTASNEIECSNGYVYRLSRSLTVKLVNVSYFNQLPYGL